MKTCKISAQSLARMWNLPLRKVLDYCRCGRFKGAQLDPITCRWWIPYPVHLDTTRRLP